MRTKGIRVLSRDRHLVRDVYLHRVVRRDDIIKLGHFSSVSRCNYRLSQLVAAGWLRRFSCVNGLPSRQSLYGLGSNSSRLLAVDLDLDNSDLDRATSAHHQGPLYIEHSLRILDFRHWLTEACARTGICLVRWLTEPECLHRFEYRPTGAAPWTCIAIKPDAQFRVESAGGSLDCFFEADLGHTSLPRFAEKLRRYERYLRSGAFEDAYKAKEFHVLSVTVGDRRREHLAELPHSGFTHSVTTWRQLEEIDLSESPTGGLILGNLLQDIHPDQARQAVAK